MTSLIVILILTFLVILITRRVRRAAADEIVQDTKVLVCSLGEGVPENLEEADASIYSTFYRHVKVLKSEEIAALLTAITDNTYDVVHLFCGVDQDGDLIGGEGSGLGGKALLEACRKANVKVLIIASDNPPDNYIKALGGDKQSPALRMNLVLTIERSGENFSNFLEGLFRRVSQGKTMPEAWVELAPQIPGRTQDNLPNTIFLANRGGVKLLP